MYLNPLCLKRLGIKGRHLCRFPPPGPDVEPMCSIRQHSCRSSCNQAGGLRRAASCVANANDRRRASGNQGAAPDARCCDRPQSRDFHPSRRQAGHSPCGGGGGGGVAMALFLCQHPVQYVPLSPTGGALIKACPLASPRTWGINRQRHHRNALP